MYSNCTYVRAGFPPAFTVQPLQAGISSNRSERAPNGIMSSNRYSSKRPRGESPTPSWEERYDAPPRAKSRTSSKGDESSFVWKKKVDQDRRRGKRTGEHEETARKERLKIELEETKARRAAREAEWAEKQAERAAEEREREHAANIDWMRSDADFQARQHFMRQAIRLQEGRPTHVDRLAWWVRLDLPLVSSEWTKDGVRKLMEENPDLPDASKGTEEGNEQESSEPIDWEALGNAVKEELTFVTKFPRDGDSKHWDEGIRMQWWVLVNEVVKDRIKRSLEGSLAVHDAVSEEMDKMITGKTMEKLIEMEKEISTTVEKGIESNDDVDFWNSALSRVQFALKVSRLEDMSEALEDERQRRIDNLPRDELEKGNRKLRFGDRATEEETEMYREEADKGFGAGEAQFSAEADTPEKKARNLVTPGYAWNDKYRPRKPKYFNRVQTGYSWSKYNRTHYDKENPPPKTVEGYKFNIFYPDLIDPTIAPTYRISRTENPEISILTFQAGPPYEDLAFKIVNRQWERSSKRGFRCSFNRGVLQLWFRFQRYRYRR